MEYPGVDWSYRRAAWCVRSIRPGVIGGEGAVPADADGLARLVIDRDTDGRAVVEMMSGAISVRTRSPARLCSPPPHGRGLARGRRSADHAVVDATRPGTDRPASGSTRAPGPPVEPLPLPPATASPFPSATARRAAHRCPAASHAGAPPIHAAQLPRAPPTPADCAAAARRPRAPPRRRGRAPWPPQSLRPATSRPSPGRPADRSPPEAQRSP